MNYRCRIEIDVEALSPKAAAERAYNLLWSPDAMRPVVDVSKLEMNEEGSITTNPYKSNRIDLSEVEDSELKENASSILRDFVLSYGGSVQWEALNDIYVRAIASLGITQEEIADFNK